MGVPRPDDQLGTLNLVTPEKRRQAAALVTEGISVSCAHDIDTRPRVDHAFGPPQRFMVATGQGLDEPNARPGRGSGVAEHIGFVYHGYTITHIDGLSHIFWDGRMYNDQPAWKVTAAEGATHHAITALAAGVITRGVLLDVAASRGVGWLEPGEGVFPDDLAAAEERQGVRVEEGDAVLLRTGYGRKLRERGPDAVGAVGRAGWHAACLPWIHERGVALIGSDTAQDAFPSAYPSMRHPVHDVGIVAMGLWLIDNCDLEALAAAAERLSRYEFMFSLAPLRMVGGTGSPVNPLGVF
jgi:kynurenine formamidase